jgi:hypothetical protein
MQADIVSMPAFTVVGMKLRTKPADRQIAKLWGDFAPRSTEIKAMPNMGAMYGVMHNHTSRWRRLRCQKGRKLRWKFSECAYFRAMNTITSLSPVASASVQLPFVASMRNPAASNIMCSSGRK